MESSEHDAANEPGEAHDVGGRSEAPAIADGEADGAVMEGVPQRGIWWRALLASALGVAGSLVVLRVWLWTTPAVIFSDQLTILIPLPLFARLLEAFAPNAKHLFFDILVGAEWLLTATVAMVYVALRPRLARLLTHGRSVAGRLDLADGIALALLPWLLSAGMLAPLIGGGFFGASLPGGTGSVFLVELLPDGIAALALVLLARWSPPRSTRGDAPERAGDWSRRRLLRAGGIAVGTLVGGALVWRFFADPLQRLLGLGGGEPSINVGDVPSHVSVPTPQYSSWTPLLGETPQLTTTSDFYYVSKNVYIDPTIEVAEWRLTIDGLVDEPYSLGLGDLMALPQVQRYHTLECISNDVGGYLMSNALFTGARIGDILARAGVQASADKVRCYAADGYSDFLHMSQALDPRSLVVYLMNGQQLDMEHGYPARLLVPGLYGMKNVKWLTRLSPANGAFTGYWEQAGWSSEARVKTMTRIDYPQDGFFVQPEPTSFFGVAYAADRGISEVDVSTDGGQTYHPATFHPAVLRRPLGPLTWVIWRYDWTPPALGDYVVIARCIDGDGNVQSPVEAPPLPDGASGYHRVSISVRAP